MTNGMAKYQQVKKESNRNNHYHHDS
jgi:hypothetical protein